MAGGTSPAGARRKEGSKRNSGKEEKRESSFSNIYLLFGTKRFSEISNKCHAGVRQKNSDVRTEFLEDVLQERLENEAATSLLIAEITEIKSRLDECCSKPSEIVLTVPASSHSTHFEGTHFEGIHGFERQVGSDLGELRLHLCAVGKRVDVPQLNENKNDRFDDILLKEHHFGDMSDKENRVGCQENQVNSKIKQSLCADHGDSLVDSEIAANPKNRPIGQKPGFGRDNSLPDKAKAWDISWRSKPQRLLPEQNRKSHTVMSSTSKHESTFLSESSMDFSPLPQRSLCASESLPVRDNISERDSQECRNHEGGGILLISSSKQLQEKQPFFEVSFGSGMRYKCAEETSRTTEKIVQVHLCCPRYSFIKPAQSLYARCQPQPLSRFPLIGQPRERLILSRLRNKKKMFSNRLRGLSNGEKLLLASIERLDLKLETISAKKKESSRNSMISEEYQSTKSAPPVLKSKTGYDSMSVKSSLFPFRPATSPSKPFSVPSRRRQNVGVTNISKEKMRKFQPSNLLEPRKGPVVCLENQREGQKISDGTIVIHQNAQFLLA